MKLLFKVFIVFLTASWLSTPVKANPIERFIAALQKSARQESQLSLEVAPFLYPQYFASDANAHLAPSVLPYIVLSPDLLSQLMSEVASLLKNYGREPAQRENETFLLFEGSRDILVSLANRGMVIPLIQSEDHKFLNSIGFTDPRLNELESRWEMEVEELLEAYTCVLEELHPQFFVFHKLASVLQQRKRRKPGWSYFTLQEAMTILQAEYSPEHSRPAANLIVKATASDLGHLGYLGGNRSVLPQYRALAALCLIYRSATMPLAPNYAAMFDLLQNAVYLTEGKERNQIGPRLAFAVAQYRSRQTQVLQNRVRNLQDSLGKLEQPNSDGSRPEGIELVSGARDLCRQALRGSNP